jgi:hypothetical protein
MDDNIEYMNGGFPPINFCPQPTNSDTQNTKKRAFSNNTQHNINIRELLSDNKIKPIITIDNTENELEIINTI